MFQFPSDAALAVSLETFNLSLFHYSASPRLTVVLRANLLRYYSVLETAKLKEIDLAFAISSAAKDADRTFRRMKDTVKHVMKEYNSDKLRYAVMVFGDHTQSPLNFSQTLPDDEMVGTELI